MSMGGANMAAFFIEASHELLSELVRDMLGLVDNVESGLVEPEHVASSKGNYWNYQYYFNDISYCFLHSPTKIMSKHRKQKKCTTTFLVPPQHTRKRERLAFDIPDAFLEYHVFSGIWACQIAAMLGVSKRTIRKRMKKRVRHLHLIHELSI